MRSLVVGVRIRPKVYLIFFYGMLLLLCHSSSTAVAVAVHPWVHVHTCLCGAPKSGVIYLEDVQMKTNLVTKQKYIEHTHT